MRRLVSPFAILVLSVSALPAGAQQPPARAASNPDAALPFGSTSSAPVSKWTPPASAGRQLTLNDLVTWKSIRSPALSNDGKWFAYILGAE